MVIASTGETHGTRDRRAKFPCKDLHGSIILGLMQTNLQTLHGSSSTFAVSLVAGDEFPVIS